MAEAQEPVNPRDYILQNWAVPALKERGFRKLNEIAWAKKLVSRGTEGRIVASFDEIEYVLIQLELFGGAYTVLWEGRIDEVYVPYVIDAAEEAFRSVPRYRYRYLDDYKHAFSMLIGGFLRGHLPKNIDVSKVYYRGGLGEAEIKEQDDDVENARRELLDVDEPWDGPWHDDLASAGFERVRANEWYKQYPFMDGHLIILAEPHLNMPDLEGVDQTKPTLRLYCEYSNPHGGVDYPVQVFQRWVPLPVFRRALDLIESAINTSNALDGLQRTLEYGFYRLVPPLGPLIPESEPVDVRSFINDDTLIEFRAAMERLGWAFKGLVMVPKLSGGEIGEVQEHVFKRVSDGTIWTLYVAALGDGRLNAYGDGFKVLQGVDSQGRDREADDPWDIPERTQQVGMSVADFAEWVSDEALSTHGQNEQEYNFDDDYDPRAEPEYWQDR